MDALQGPLHAAGRAALSAMFVAGGADAFLRPGDRAQQAARLGLPLEPELAVRLNGATMGAAGVALAGHPFWREEDPDVRRQRRIHCLKNLGRFGGTLPVLAERR